MKLISAECKFIYRKEEIKKNVLNLDTTVLQLFMMNKNIHNHRTVQAQYFIHRSLKEYIMRSLATSIKLR